MGKNLLVRYFVFVAISVTLHVNPSRKTSQLTNLGGFARPCKCLISTLSKDQRLETHHRYRESFPLDFYHQQTENHLEVIRVTSSFP